MNAAKLFLALSKLALVETPNLHSERHAKYLDGIRQMADLYVQVGTEGRIVSPEVDPVLLAAIGYEESRHRPSVVDGDCFYASSRRICYATGPMQINKAAPKLLAIVDPSSPVLTAEQLRDPATSVRTAYRLLDYYKTKCTKGGVPALLGNWSAGKCAGVFSMGKRRCALAKAIGKAAAVDVSVCTTSYTDVNMPRILKALEAP